MKREDEVLALLKKAVQTWNPALAAEAAEESLRIGIEPKTAIEKGLGEGMAVISDMFNEGKVYLPQVLAASQAMEAGMRVLEPYMVADSSGVKGIIIIGTVQGDIHELGKHVVSAFLRADRFRVIDLGKDVPPEAFIQVARKEGACIIGASALMTTTLVGQRQIVEHLKEEKLFHIKTIFGGACCSQKWVSDIGGDAYCACGSKVVSCVNELLAECKRSELESN
jgi:corrinoid protein of di/trimethylamine methyltransferase